MGRGYGADIAGLDDQEDMAPELHVKEDRFSISLDTYDLQKAGWTKEEAEASRSFTLIRESIQSLLHRSFAQGYVHVGDVESTIRDTIGLLIGDLSELAERDMVTANEEEQLPRDFFRKRYQEVSAAIYSLGVVDSYYGSSELVQSVEEAIRVQRRENLEGEEAFLPNVGWIAEEHLSMGELEISWERFQEITGLTPADPDYLTIEDGADFPAAFDIKEGKLYPRADLGNL